MKPRRRFDGVSIAGVQALARLFAGEAERQPFDLPDDELGVWAVHHRSPSGNVRVLLWPALDRIDVAVGPHMWVVKGVRELELIEGLEFIARFGERGVLTVALDGQVTLTTPAD